MFLLRNLLGWFPHASTFYCIFPGVSILKECVFISLDPETLDLSMGCSDGARCPSFHRGHFP